MTEEPKATPATTEELVEACRATHRYVCLPLKALQTPALNVAPEHETPYDVEHALVLLGQAASALARYIQANASDRAAPVRETEPNPEPEPAGPVPPEPEPNPEPVGQVPAEPERT